MGRLTRGDDAVQSEFADIAISNMLLFKSIVLICLASAILDGVYSFQVSRRNTSLSCLGAVPSRPLVSTEESKARLLELIEAAPSNALSSATTTKEILQLAKDMEGLCPTKDNDVVAALAGNWELLWTAQDPSSPESKRGLFRSWVNNNPNKGRSNPFLPQPVQDKLEELGLVSSSKEGDKFARSSQAIDIKKQEVRNLVTFNVPTPSGKRKVTLVVLADVKPNMGDPRKVDVTFRSFRVRISDKFDFKFPLGIFGPSGWLRTIYIDDSFRITRGQKGSVFVLRKPST